MARDNGSPQNLSPQPAVVDIDVTRNTAPFFTNLQTGDKYTNGVDMTLPANGLVYRTSASDLDSVVCWVQLFVYAL